MALASVETFEGDIAEEIKHKETTMTDVIAAHGSVEEVVKQEKNSQLVLVLVFLMIGLSVVILIAFYLYTRSTTTSVAPVTQTPTPTLPEPQTTPVIPQAQNITISEILPTTGQAISRFVNGSLKSDSGYVITINDYPSVFGYLLQNEGTFAQETLSLFNEQASGTTQFIDVTENNQDMRVLSLSTSTDSGVVYGFVGTTTLLITESKTNFFLLRNSLTSH